MEGNGDNDHFRGLIDPERIVDNLNKLFEHYKGIYPEKGNAAILRLISSRLAQQKDKKSYTWNYLHGILNGKLLPSKKVSKAILYECSITIHKQSKVQLEVVRVLAPVGTEEEMALISRSSKICERCKSPFVPNNNQKYCLRCRRRTV